MGRPCFLSQLLLVSFFTFLLFSHGTHGFGRTLKSTVQDDVDSPVPVMVALETGGKSREMIEVMDYGEPKANVNPREVVFSPPPK